MFMMTKSFETFEKESDGDDSKTVHDKVSILEKYVLSEERKEDFFNTLVIDSDMYKYFKFNDVLKHNDPKLVKSIEKPIEEFCGKIQSGQSKVLQFEVLFRWMLYQIDQEKNEEKRKKLMHRFSVEFLGQNKKSFDDYYKDVSKEKTKHTSGNEDKFNFVKVLRDAIGGKGDLNKAFTDIDHAYLTKIDILKAVESSTEYSKFTILEDFDNFIGLKNLKEAFIKWYSEKCESGRKTHNNLKTIQKLTTAQMELLLKDYPALAGDATIFKTYLQKKFETEDVLPNIIESPEKVIEFLGNIIKLAGTFKEKLGTPQKICSALKLCKIYYRSLLPDISKRINYPEISDYLTSGPCILPNIPLSEKREGYGNRDFLISPLLKVVSGSSLTSIILTHFFEITAENPTKDQQAFSSLFNLKPEQEKLLITERLLRGENLPQVMKHFSEIELNLLRDSQNLRLLEDNPSSFGPGDVVSLRIEIKNVKNLLVNVFEINTKNYYLTKRSPVDARLDLSGLVPSTQLKVEYKQQNMTRHTETFDFEEITKTRRGIFVIEFLGDGLCSRALIKKGGLNLIQIGERRGLEFNILDEACQICKGAGAGLSVGSKTYTAEENGLVSVPYFTKAFEDFVLVEFEGYSELYMLKAPAFNYSLDYSLLYNEESLAGGETCLFALAPKLYFNDRVAPLDYLSDCEVVITSTDCDGLVNAQTFSSLHPSSDSSLLIEYLIPHKTVRLQFEFKADLTLGHSGEQSTIREKKVVEILQQNGKETTYLSYSKKVGYSLSVLAKNGEPVPDKKVAQTFSHYFKKSVDRFDETTGSSGSLKLGALEGVSSLAVNFAEGEGCYKSWGLSNFSKYKCIPRDITIVEGEDLMLPALEGSVSETKYCLTRVDSSFSSVYTDCEKQIEASKGVLYLVKLKAGFYCFKYIVGDKVGRPPIRISVVSGKRWESSNEFLLSDRRVERLQNQSNYLTFDELKIEKDELSLKVYSNQTEHVKVHLLAYNYLPSNFREIETSLSSTNVAEPRTVFEITPNYNQYLSEKSVSDEVKYVIARQNVETFTGNTLERPTGLLKKEFNKLTEADSQKENQEKVFKVDSSSEKARAIRKLEVMKYSKPSKITEFKVEVDPSFLKNKGGIIASCEVDVDGRAIIDISKHRSFPYLILVIEDMNNSISHIIHNAETPVVIGLKDIRLQNKRKEEAIYFNERSVRLLEPGKTLVYEDSTNLKVNSLGDIRTLFQMVKALSISEKLSEWEFITKWNGLSSKEKLQYYNKYMGHELNVFLFFKDKEFFEIVVKKHLANKTNKTFIDYFIVEDSESLKKWLSPQAVSKLNLIELALFVYSLKKSGDEKTARRIHEFIRLKSIEDKVSPVEFKVRFDSILKFNSTLSDLASSARSLGSKGEHLKTTTEERGEEPELGGGGGGYSMPGIRSSSKRHGGIQKRSVPTENVFSEVGSTYEYGETDYYLSETGPKELASHFWLAVSEAFLGSAPSEIVKTKILSEKFMMGKSEPSEWIFFLAFLSLPFEKQNETLTRSNNRLEIKSQSQSIVFSKQLIERPIEREELDIIVSQKFFNEEEPAYDSNRNRVYNSLKQFVMGKIYGSKVAVTNMSDHLEQVDLLMEIPQGSIPIKSKNYTYSKSFDIDSFATNTFYYYFYFPQAGDFGCYPATVSKEGKLVRSAAIPKAFKVTPEPPKKDESSLESLIEKGKKDLIISKLSTTNLLSTETDFNSLLSPLLHDKSFHKKVTDVFREQFVLNKSLWIGGIYHADLQCLKEYLDYTFNPGPIDVKDFNIYAIKTNMLEVDCFNANEYDPLVNPRAHFIGEHKHNILNRELLDTYMKFLKYLVDKPLRTTRDRIQLASYLLLQDRIPEALKQVEMIDQKEPRNGELQIQLDHLLAFTHLSQDKPESFKNAKEICSKYLAYPIISWRNKFIQMSNLIAECEGDIDSNQNESSNENVASRNRREAEEEPILNGEVKKDFVLAQWANVKDIEVHFFVIDIEVKFSIDPFATQQSTTFAFIKPNFSSKVKTNTAENTAKKTLETTSIEIPEELKKENMVIQLIAGVKSVFLNYFPSSMSVFPLYEQGHIKVTDQAGKPIERAYVKVFVQKKSSTGVKYYKDGYTDFKGNFDFATLNLEPENSIREYSILVLSKSHGSHIVRIDPSKLTTQQKSHSALESNLTQKPISESGLRLQKETAPQSKYHIA